MLKKYIIKEIPIIYRDRPEGSTSKLNTVEDGIKVIKTILRMFKDYKPFKFFGIRSNEYLNISSVTTVFIFFTLYFL